MKSTRVRARLISQPEELAGRQVHISRSSPYRQQLLELNDIKPAIGPPQQIVWAVRRNAPQLLDSLNRWIDTQRRRGLLAVLYRKYFLDRRAFRVRAKSGYLTAETGRLSPYDDWFREYAAREETRQRSLDRGTTWRTG